MSEDKKINGWANYPTWCVALWIDNEEVRYNYWQDVAKNTPDVQALAERLKDEHDCAAVTVVKSRGVFSDLLGYVLEQVNWEEIARSLLED